MMKEYKYANHYCHVINVIKASLSFIVNDKEIFLNSMQFTSMSSIANLCTPPCLLVSNTSDIVAIDYKTAAVTPVVTGLSRAVAIDIHFSLGYIFWSDVTDLNIKRFRIDVASTTTIITSIGVCGGLAVDWRASQLYWTDETSDTISMSDLEGNIQGTLISSGLHTPRDIALDPDNGYDFFFTIAFNTDITNTTDNSYNTNITYNIYITYNTNITCAIADISYNTTVNVTYTTITTNTTITHYKWFRYSAYATDDRIWLYIVL